jgi:MarR family transcriptional regulator, organic hydroperoxide resistance regulator
MATVTNDSKRRPARTRAPAKRRTKQTLTVSLPQFLVDGTDLDFREFVADLFAAVGGMHSLRRALAQSVGLSAAEFSVILATWHLQQKGTVGISAIAKHLHVAAAHVTAEAGRLVTKGLLKKKPDPRDTRAVLVSLTEPGKKILLQLTPLLRRINDRLFSGNTTADVTVLSKFLKHLAEESATSIRMARAFGAEDRVEHED